EIRTFASRKPNNTLIRSSNQKQISWTDRILMDDPCKSGSVDKRFSSFPVEVLRLAIDLQPCFGQAFGILFCSRPNRIRKSVYAKSFVVDDHQALVLSSIFYHLNPPASKKHGYSSPAP